MDIPATSKTAGSVDASIKMERLDVDCNVRGSEKET